MNNHFLQVHGPKTVACTDGACSKTFATIGVMNKHFKRTHVPKRKFTEAFPDQNSDGLM